jgi:hypothetical protein
LLYSSILLVSCAIKDGDSGADGDIDYRGSDCISIRTIRDYTPLDNRSLLVEGSGKRMYYVQLGMPSFDLRGSFRLGFESRDDWFCPYGGDEIVLDGMMNDRVSVRAISRISAEQADDLLIRHGKKEPAEQEDPPPPELDGAEVEELGETG